MNFNALLARARDILLKPRDTWPAIAAEPATPASLYTGWVLWLAAIPPLASFIGRAVFGISVPFVGTVRLGLGGLLTHLLVSYAVALVMVFVMALIVDALAPGFGGSKDRLQALKTVAYAYTPVWIVGVLGLIPQLMALTALLSLAAAGYAIYLLYLGLPATMKCPQDKAAGYAAVSVIIGIVLAIVLGAIVGRTLTFGRMDGTSGFTLGDRNASGRAVNSNSALGRSVKISDLVNARGMLALTGMAQGERATGHG